jgi:hypothetical protein
MQWRWAILRDEYLHLGKKVLLDRWRDSLSLDSLITVKSLIRKTCQMRLKHAACEGDTIYGVASTGELWWFHLGKTPKQIDRSRWQHFIHVVAGDDGILYAVRRNGEMLWYQDTLRDGTNGIDGNRGWARNCGHVIGDRWNKYMYVLPGGDGVLYAIDRNGDIYWYQDLKRDGLMGWAPKSGSQIGAGWNKYRHVFSGRNGTIYAITHEGNLLWCRDLFRNGTNAPDGSTGWTARSLIDTGGWDQATYAVSGGSGIIYSFEFRNFIFLRRNVDTHDDGTATGWGQPDDPYVQHGECDQSPDNPRWQLIPLEGYCWPVSGAPGETIEFKLSSVLDVENEVSIVRVQEEVPGYPASLGIPTPVVKRVAGVYQPSNENSWRDGCDWKTSFPLRIPDWPTGIYAAKYTSPTGFTFWVPFVVKPEAGKKGDFLFIVNTNTWNSYNQWGGESNYSFPSSGSTFRSKSYARPNPHLLTVRHDLPPRNHLVRAEAWLLDWLIACGYRVDVVTDIDVHKGLSGMDAYKAVILQTHPEYWSKKMFITLEEFLKLPKRSLLYLGGNGIFRVVKPTDNFMSFETAASGNYNTGPELFQNQGMPQSRILGVWYGGGLHSAPYKVKNADHRFFKGTSLKNGEEFGAKGRNGPASGIEVDYSVQGQSPMPFEYLATGGADSVDGNMVYRSTSAGGFVFSVGSISFGGSLVVDKQLQKIVCNALDASLT